MKRYQLAMAVKETEYVRRVADYVRNSRFGERWQVTAFTNAAACKQYVKQGYGIDMIVAEPELLRELQDGIPPIPSAALVGKLGDSHGNHHELLQYQSLPLLLKGVSELHETLSGARKQSANRDCAGGEAIVLAIHSASGGVGKTAAALYLAQAAGTQGLRVFYYNLERWNATPLWLDRHADLANTGEGMSEFLYCVKAQPDHAAQWLSRHSKYDHLLKADYVPGFANMDDRLTLNAADAVAMTKLIAQSGRYDLMIVDLDDGMEEMHMSLLELANHSLMLVTDDSSIARKQQLFLRYAEQKWDERFRQLLRKSELVLNRADGSDRQMKMQPLFNMSFAPVALPEIAEWSGSEAQDLLASAVFRAAASRLLKHVLGERLSSTGGEKSVQKPEGGKAAHAVP